MAGTLPTLKPLFKRVLGTYGSHSKTSREYFSKYKMHSMSRSRGPPLQSLGHRSGNLSIVEADLDDKTPFQVTSTSRSMTYPESGRSNSSEERILPDQGEGIICTTEVKVSRTQDKKPPPVPSSSPPTVPKLGRMGSLNGPRVDTDDRV